MTSQPWEQTLSIHILPYISRRKDNQTKKFGRLIEYSMRNISKCDGETSPRLFSKKSKLNISLDQ